MIIGFLSIIPFSTAADDSVVTISPASAVPGCEEKNECYVPHLIQVNTNKKITWNNMDSATHTVTSGRPDVGSDGKFDSGLIVSGNIFENKFDDDGEYHYFCIIHPWMTGSILVGEDFEVDEPSNNLQTENELRQRIAELMLENRHLKLQIVELEQKIQELNELVLEQLKIITDWINLS